MKDLLDDVLKLGGRIGTFKAETKLFGALPEFDSMAVVTIVTAIEERFDVAINDDEITADVFATVGSLAHFIEQKTAGQRP